MSSWSVESKGSAQTTSSSEAGSERASPSVSRNASFQSTGTASVSSLSFQPQTSSASQPNSQGQSQDQTSPQAAAGTGSSSNSSGSATPSPEQDVECDADKSKAAAAAAGGSNSAKRMKKKLEAPKTVTTLMGGRGYINWRRTSMEKQRTSAHAQINNTDAFLVVWEMKL